MVNTVSRTIADETLSRIIHIECGGRPTAKAPTSSASGLGQFINATWLATIARHKPAWAAGRTEAQLLELRADSPCSRFNPRCSIEMLARFTEDNAAVLGAGYSDGDLYLAHFAGVGTARKLFRISAEVPASAVFSAAAIAANKSILSGKDCGDVREWANRKMKAAGGRNWIAVHMAGAKPVTTAKDKATTAVIATGGAGAGAGTVQVAVDQGWGLAQWLVAGGCAALVVAAIIGAVIWWRRRNTLVKIETELA